MAGMTMRRKMRRSRRNSKTSRIIQMKRKRYTEETRWRKRGTRTKRMRSLEPMRTLTGSRSGSREGALMVESKSWIGGNSRDRRRHLYTNTTVATSTSNAVPT